MNQLRVLDTRELCEVELEELHGRAVGSQDPPLAANEQRGGRGGLEHRSEALLAAAQERDD